MPAELSKALVTQGERELYEICNQIYIQGEWPHDFLEAIIIPMEKKKMVHKNAYTSEPLA